MDTERRADGWLGNWLVIGGIAGIVFVVLFIIGIGTQGDVPQYTDSTEEISTYFADHSDRYLIGDLIIGIAILVFYLPFLACLVALLWNAMRVVSPWPILALIAGILFPAAGVAAGVFNGALALLEGNTSDEVVLAFSAASFYGFSLGSATVALLVLASSIVILQTGLFPRWLAWLGLLVAIAGILGIASVLDNDPEGLFGFITFLIVFPGFGIWIVGIAINMLRRRDSSLG